MSALDQLDRFIEWMKSKDGAFGLGATERILEVNGRVMPFDEFTRAVEKWCKEGEDRIDDIAACHAMLLFKLNQ